MDPVRAQYEHLPYPPVPVLALPPWDEPAWQQLAARMPDACAQWCDGARVPGAGLADQAEWLPLRQGSTRPWINYELRAG